MRLRDKGDPPPQMEPPMSYLLLRWIVLTVAVLIAAYTVDGIAVSGFFSALCAAALLGILNAVLRPILVLLTLPITVLSFGLFLLVINAVLLSLVSSVIRGFDVQGFWPAVFGSILISAVNWALNALLSRHPRGMPTRRAGGEDVIDLEHRGGNRWE